MEQDWKLLFDVFYYLEEIFNYIAPPLYWIVYFALICLFVINIIYLVSPTMHEIIEKSDFFKTKIYSKVKKVLDIDDEDNIKEIIFKYSITMLIITTVWISSPMIFGKIIGIIGIATKTLSDFISNAFR